MFQVYNHCPIVRLLFWPRNLSDCALEWQIFKFLNIFKLIVISLNSCTSMMEKPSHCKMSKFMGEGSND